MIRLCECCQNNIKSVGVNLKWKYWSWANLVWLVGHYPSWWSIKTNSKMTIAVHNHQLNQMIKDHKRFISEGNKTWASKWWWYI